MQFDLLRTIVCVCVCVCGCGGGWGWGEGGGVGEEMTQDFVAKGTPLAFCKTSPSNTKLRHLLTATSRASASILFCFALHLKNHRVCVLSLIHI